VMQMNHAHSLSKKQFLGKPFLQEGFPEIYYLETNGLIPVHGFT
jgi:hypothetical protein